MNSTTDLGSSFDPGCRRCPRLAAFLDTVHQKEPSYYCRPVPAFGDPQARLLIVGLAPGMHGANRTRQAVYRRFRRDTAVPDTAQVRACQRPDFQRSG